MGASLHNTEPLIPASAPEAGLAAIFEERAENLSREELRQWSGETGRDRALLAKLKGLGAKLLSGPRGSGKSTLLRKAYFALIEERQAVPVYVNFSRSLVLEPLFHHQADALQLFRQWVVYKIISGCLDSFASMETTSPESLRTLGEEGVTFIRALETGQSNAPPSRPVAPSQLLILLEEWVKAANRTRCVLLLDDAAHAFSPEQQRDLFEIFRALRSRSVAAKAAVYPGITSYSPYFHVGHEAELLEAWYNPDDEEYLGTMRSVLQNRLPSTLYNRFGTLHYSIVLVENSLALGKSFAIEDVIRSLSKTSSHSFVRARPIILLGSNYQDRCTLDLAPCPKCGTPRTSEDAHFCVKCGSELRDASIYEELVDAPIDSLPLTDNKLNGLRAHTSIRKVKDSLLDEESTEIRKVRYVGPVWAARIRNAALEYVSV